MKYLRRYNESHSERMTESEINTMIDTIEYIFLDIKDDGFKLDYSGVLLNITISKPKDTILGSMGVQFNLNEIIGVVKHLYNYLSSIEKISLNNMKIQTGGLGNNITIDEIESFDPTKYNPNINRFTMTFDEKYYKNL